MARAETTKEIDLGQLNQELGGYGLLGAFENGVQLVQTEDGSPVTLEQLEAAITKHVPVVKVLTAAEKLFNATGLTVAEYKALVL
jgi:hypothetical protein